LGSFSSQYLTVCNCSGNSIVAVLENSNQASVASSNFYWNSIEEDSNAICGVLAADGIGHIMGGTASMAVSDCIFYENSPVGRSITRARDSTVATFVVVNCIFSDSLPSTDDATLSGNTVGETASHRLLMNDASLCFAPSCSTAPATGTQSVPFIPTLSRALSSPNDRTLDLIATFPLFLLTPVAAQTLSFSLSRVRALSGPFNPSLVDLTLFLRNSALSPPQTALHFVSSQFPTGKSRFRVSHPLTSSERFPIVSRRKFDPSLLLSPSSHLILPLTIADSASRSSFEDRPTVTFAAASSPTRDGSPAPGTRLTPGALVGIVVGSIVFVGLVVFLGFVLWRRRTALSVSYSAKEMLGIADIADTGDTAGTLVSLEIVSAVTYQDNGTWDGTFRNLIAFE
jgi:hypothetical protein